MNDAPFDLLFDFTSTEILIAVFLIITNLLSCNFTAFFILTIIRLGAVFPAEPLAFEKF